MVHLKGDICRFVLNTNSFLYDVREMRCKQNNMGSVDIPVSHLGPLEIASFQSLFAPDFVLRP